MDGQRHRFGERKESEHGVNYSRGRNRQRARNYRHRRHQNVNSFTQSRQRHVTDSRVQSVQQASTSSTSVNTRVLEIPGFIYDPVKKRYFKEEQGQPKNFEPKQFGIQNETKCQDNARKSRCKILSRLQYLQNRETNILHNNVHFKRKGSEDWARNIVERKSFLLRNTDTPASAGSLSCFALSNHCGKLVTIVKRPGLGCNTIHIYDTNHDKMEFINPLIPLATIRSKVTHVEWNPNESMKDVFLLNCLGSADLNGSAVVYDFSRSCLTPFSQQNVTVWHCSWSRNPQFSSFFGIAGSKQAVLVDFVKKLLVCKIRLTTDVFCIEFTHKSPVAYLGCRNGNVMCVDFRVNKQSEQFNVSGRVKSSATSMKVMQDENYLMASSIDGMIKMWDVRLSKPVKEYAGNVNEAELIPFVMDSSENIVASAGHDGKTRIWSIQTCELLNTIDATNTRNDDIDIPPVCLGENWPIRNNMMALGLGIEDKLKLYF